MPCMRLVSKHMQGPRIKLQREGEGRWGDGQDFAGWSQCGRTQTFTYQSMQAHVKAVARLTAHSQLI